MSNLSLGFVCIFSLLLGSGCSAPQDRPVSVQTGTGVNLADEIVGHYRLIAVNGIKIPARVRHGDAEILVHSGRFVIDADRSCHSKLVFSPPSGDRITRSVDATYTRSGSTLLMDWRGAGTTRGEFDKDVFSMDNHGMIFRYQRIDSTGGCDATAGKIDAAPPASSVFEDFESDLPFTQDSNGIPMGYFTFRGPRNGSVLMSQSNAHPRLAQEKVGNQTLRLDLDIPDWGGIIHHFQDASGSHWTAADWRGFESVSFWLRGTNSGTGLFIEILDNRNPCSTMADAELFSYSFKDDFLGWKRITVPFDKFTRKEIGNGAPDDGMSLASVHGWAFGVLHTGGPLTLYLDNFELR